MGIILHENVNAYTEFGVWKIEESEDELFAKAKSSFTNLELYKSIANKNRRMQWLSARVLLSKLLNSSKGINVEIDKNNKPYLTNIPYTFSISHSQCMSAVIISKTHNVGIDIEKINPRIIKLEQKILSNTEQTFIEVKKKDTLLLHICWGAKEAVYKLNGKRGISLKNDIQLNKFNPLSSGFIYASIKNDNKLHKVNYREINNYLLAFCILPKEL